MPDNGKLIYIYGLRRSGNHAIIEWLHGVAEHTEHFNNQKIFKPLLWKPKTKSPRDFVTISYEEVPIPKREPLPSPETYIGSIGQKYNMIILRDPFNLFASRMKHKGLRKETLDDLDFFVKEWKSHANEFVGNTNKLSNGVHIAFNQWFESQKYRMGITYALGVPFSDNQLNTVSKKGHGSSFSGVNFNGKAQKMKVNDRWVKMIKDRKYKSIVKKILKNTEIMGLVESIFGREIINEVRRNVK